MKALVLATFEDPASGVPRFTAEGDKTALIVNFPTELYNYEVPDEYRLPYNDPSIPYSWEIRHG